MVHIVGVHGIAQQFKGPALLAQEWATPMKDGVTAAGKTFSVDDLVCAFYGGLFRPPGKTKGDFHYRRSDITEDEAELLTGRVRAGCRRRADGSRKTPARAADLSGAGQPHILG